MPPVFINDRPLLTAGLFFSFLTIDCHCYLPPYQCVSIYFLKDLISGKKKRIANKDVEHVTIPQYEGCGIKEICNYLMQHKTIGDWFPDMIEVGRLPKEWIGNVAFTILGQPFGTFIKDQIEARNRKVLVDRQNEILMDPEMAAAFQQSTAVSTHKGIGANLLRVGIKRKRTKQ